MRRTLGFTLIEVMIAVVVIAILTAIAYPSYLEYVRRGQRALGQQFLLDLAQRQEQYLIDNRAYATSIGTVAGAGVLIMTVPVEVAAKYQAYRVWACMGMQGDNHAILGGTYHETIATRSCRNTFIGFAVIRKEPSGCGKGPKRSASKRRPGDAGNFQHP